MGSRINIALADISNNPNIEIHIQTVDEAASIAHVTFRAPGMPSVVKKFNCLVERDKFSLSEPFTWFSSHNDPDHGKHRLFCLMLYEYSIPFHVSHS